MHSERWDALSPLLDELFELSGESRQMRLYQMQEQYPELAKELLKMMALEESHPDFLAEPLANLDSLSPRADHEIGPYRLVSMLGEGGMGQVWLALRSDGLYERRVALKLLRPGLGHAGLRQRFTRERQILARLAHANIARLLDAGEAAAAFSHAPRSAGDPRIVRRTDRRRESRGRMRDACAANDERL